MDYEKLIESIVNKRGSDPYALQDAMTAVREYEKVGASYVSQGVNRDDLEVLDPKSSAGAHKMSALVRKAAALSIANGGGDKALEVYYDTHLFDAPVSFDSFMLFMERERPKEEQFWLPRRKSSLRRVVDTLQEMETGDLSEVFISMPPRVGKTTVVDFFINWVMLRDPERSNLYCSFSDTVVKAFYNGLLEVLADKYTYKWREIFPSRELANTNAKDGIINIDRRKRYASFTARSIEGSLNGSCDCDGYEIADDLHSGIEEAVSPPQLETKWSRVVNNFLPRGKSGCKRIWIGTRWAQGDCQGRRLDLLENDPQYANYKWKAVSLPALNEQGESNFDYLYGVGFSTEDYKRVRASFERSGRMADWFAQYQGVPVDRQGLVFEPDMMRYYNGTLPDGEPDRVFMTVDPSWGGGDFTAAPVCCVYGDDVYIPAVVYNNGDKTVTQPLIASAVADNNVQSVEIEATRATATYTEGVQQILLKRGIHINVTSTTKHWSGQQGKEQRIFDKAPDIRMHMIFLASGYRTKEYEQFMGNLFHFRMGMNKHDHDDAPDSLAMAIGSIWSLNRKAKMSVQERRRIW